MKERLRELIELRKEDRDYDAFVNGLESSEGLTRDENPSEHYCVYFAAYDPTTKEVFMGHHKKSGLWLFNGGHIDEGEEPEIALVREIGEEWGLEMLVEEIGGPQLLTVTEINNLEKQTCTKHFDIWYFVNVNKEEFAPSAELMDKEFHEYGWIGYGVAKDMVIDPSTIVAIERLESL